MGGRVGARAGAALQRTFAEAAGRLAGLSGAAFGWRPDEFWRATPAELAALTGAGAEDAVAPPDAAWIATMLKEHPDG